MSELQNSNLSVKEAAGESNEILLVLCWICSAGAEKCRAGWIGHEMPGFRDSARNARHAGQGRKSQACGTGHEMPGMRDRAGKPRHAGQGRKRKACENKGKVKQDRKCHAGMLDRRGNATHAGEERK